MSTCDWLTFLAWEFNAAVLIGAWWGWVRDRRMNELAARVLIAYPIANTTPPTVTELNGALTRDMLTGI